MAIKDNRGKAGAKALKKDKEEKINKNIKKLKIELEFYRTNNLNFTIKDISEKTKLSMATLYRSPYKEVIDSYKSKDNILSSSEQIEILIFERDELRKEIKLLKEENRRLLDEITYSKNFFK